MDFSKALISKSRFGDNNNIKPKIIGRYLVELSMQCTKPYLGNKMPWNVCSAFAVGIGSLATVVSAQQYAISPLGYRPDSTDTIPVLISNSQIIVGFADIGIPPGQTPFFLSAGSPAVFPSSPGNTIFSPEAINDSGTVAGFLMPNAQHPLPAFYSAALYQNGQYVELSPPALSTGAYTDNFRALALNNSGEAVGFVNVDESQMFAVSWVNGQASLIDADSNESSSANAINDQGWIAGAIGPVSGAYANPVIWHDGQVIHIALPGNATSGCAIAINNAQQVLVSYTGPNIDDGFLVWDQGVETLLPGFSDPIYGTYATSMNDSGVVVGTSANHAVLWQNGQICDLNDLVAPDSGWVLTDATSINDPGDIVGYGTYDGSDVPFLLTPTGEISVPEPALTPVLATALTLLAHRRRYKPLA
ncbi:MAG TPA: hypothetical protein VGG19_00740 [Tepidisphaeraceae bacterium]